MNRKGITISILVITIIVLIILSFAVISLMNNDDVINETNRTTNDFNKVQIITAIKDEIRQYRMDQELIGNYTITEAEIRTIIEKYGTISNYNQEEVLTINENSNIFFYEIDSVFRVEQDENTVILMHFENFNDSSKNNYVVTNVNNDSVIQDNGKFGKCVEPLNYIEVDTGSFELGNVWTIEWWQNIRDLNSEINVILIKGYYVNEVNGGFVLRYVNPAQRTGFEFWGTNGSYINRTFQRTNIYPKYNTWEHIAVVSNGVNIKIYIEGVLKYTVNRTWTISAKDYPFIIGNTPSNYSVNGYIDELRISNIARYTENFTPQTEPFN